MNGFFLVSIIRYQVFNGGEGLPDKKKGCRDCDSLKVCHGCSGRGNNT